MFQIRECSVLKYISSYQENARKLNSAAVVEAGADEEGRIKDLTISNLFSQNSVFT